MEHLPRQRVKRSTSTLKGEAERVRQGESDATNGASIAGAALPPDPVEGPPLGTTTSDPRSRSRHPPPLPKTHRPAPGFAVASEKIEQPTTEGQSHDATSATAALAVVDGGDVVGGTKDPVVPQAVKPQGMWDTIVESYRGRPIAFVEDLLLRNHPDFKLEDWQRRFLKAVARGERRISVRAGHGVGKSAACSFAAIWFMFTRYPFKGIVTAPTQSQLFDALFSEIKRWINELPQFMRDQIEVFSDRIELKASPENSFLSARTSSAERPEAMAGIHSENVLLICDEASAIPEPVFEAASGSMSGFTATTILISNPTRNTGLFFKTHHGLARDWFRLHVSCLDSKLVSPDFIRQIAATYGEASNAYRVRVLGEFSEHEDDVLIAAELVDAAMTRDIVLDVTAPLVYGLDIARFGDDRTVLLKRQGDVVIEYKVWSGQDLMSTVGRVIHEAQIDKPVEICVDSIGLGAGVADRLREQGHPVRDVNVSEMSALNPQAAKLRDDLWLQVRDWLMKRSCKLPKSEELRGDLVGPTYGFLSNGKLKVESKQDMKRRGLRSPDIGDSLCLSFASAAAMVGGRGLRWVPGKPLKRNILGVV